MTPRLFEIAARSAAKRLTDQRQHDRWCVWHSAFLDKTKTPGRMQDFVRGGKPKTSERQTADELMLVMDRWRFAMAGVEASTAPPVGPRKKPKRT